ATLFSLEIPIPLPALGAAGQSLGVEAPQPAIARLIGLGLFDDWGEIDRVAHAAANPLARPLARALDPADRPRLARTAIRNSPGPGGTVRASFRLTRAGWRRPRLRSPPMPSRRSWRLRFSREPHGLSAGTMRRAGRAP